MTKLNFIYLELLKNYMIYIKKDQFLKIILFLELINMEIVLPLLLHLMFNYKIINF